MSPQPEGDPQQALQPKQQISQTYMQTPVMATMTHNGKGEKRTNRKKLLEKIIQSHDISLWHFFGDDLDWCMTLKVKGI